MQKIDISQLLDSNNFPIAHQKKPVKWAIFTRNGLVGSYTDYGRAKRTAWGYTRDHNTETWLVKMHKKYTPRVIVFEQNYQK